MTVGDVGWRFGGVVACVAAGGTSLLHREVLAARGGGPATGAEVVLGLLSFLLASLGVLLLIHGAALRRGWRREPGAGTDDPLQGPTESPRPNGRGYGSRPSP